MNTNFLRDRAGHKATTVLDLGNQRELQITTSKSSNGPLTTRASVHQIEGNARRHALGFGGIRGDFSKQIGCSFPARVTANAVREQHERCLAQLEEIKQAIQAHYEAQAAANA
ncbi:hypothetical protein [Comamonas terrigena]|uniref:hypothetical protein n=1 Tax=Comamonas terrigena TaxID=32013 RepID=UPI0028AF90A8|nr:hypothetical protein [Comamonas terrigena]